MKYKVIKDKKNGETRIDYFKVANKNTFRWDALKKLMCEKEMMIRIDTNLVNSEAKDIDISKSFEEYFEMHNIPYQVLPTEKNKFKKILGINLKMTRENAYIILFHIKEEDMTNDFFKQYLENCDLDIGITPKRSFEEIYKELQKGYFTSFFGCEYFEEAIYDSNYIGSMRISPGIEVDV
ncbi:MAG: hypothetical protein CVU84_13320 [Firmicutes bacterium HGW-Firmicutes-1]|jgi:hypothetical protein|nr:MAG: hypothetical protein CVU84_13320 [Firmicutes bacterium HGW-Firmicutes-1]